MGILSRLAVCAALVGLAHAQSNDTYAAPSNTSYAIPLDAAQQLVIVDTQNLNFVYPLKNLTAASLTDLTNPNAPPVDSGPVAYLTDSNASSIASPHSIAYISCDAANYQSYVPLNTVIMDAVSAPNVQAILFFTLNGTTCNFTGPTSGLPHLYSTVNPQNASAILQSTSRNTFMFSEITTSRALQNAHAQTSSGGASGGSGTPQTTVAMIILYSITGIITLLFLIIIITGAVRAHRHPERYGPRSTAVAGGRSTRQSRAKGIARAMLETLPIVKFNQQDQVPSKDADIEIGRVSSSAQGQDHHSNPSAAPRVTDSTAAPVAAHIDDDAASTRSPAHNDEHPSCSICTEDFEDGQDIRVLPCDHKFHPACVDPWLLDVSGTCPLCRVDLRPAKDASTEPRSTASDTTAYTASMPPPLDPAGAPANGSGSRLHALLHRLQPSTAEERIAALRRFRREGTPRAEEDDQEVQRSRWQRVRRRVRLGGSTS